MNRKNIILFLSFIVFYAIFTNTVSAQFEIEDPVKIIPPSPTAASLGNYGGLNVGMHTGAASASIPLHTLRTKYLSLPISLNYSSNGIKVDQLASWVGMGWDLDVGGAITRTVMDKPDEYLRKPLPFFNSITADVAVYLDNVLDNGDDIQPDVYTFKVPGYSGKFVYSDDNIPILMPMQLVSINQTNLDSNSFEISTPDGIKYYFGKNAKETSYNRTTGSGCTSKMEFTEPAITGWYLSKIVHPKGDSIEFVYGSTGYMYYTSVSQTYYHLAASEGDCVDCEPPVLDPKTCFQFVHVSGVYLKEIRTTNFGKILFEVSGRVDNPGDVKLDSIIVLDAEGSKLKSFEFDYLQTTSTKPSSLSDQPELKERFYLSGIKEYGLTTAGEAKNHLFTYNDPSSLPARLSYSQDHWGYYNGRINYYFVPKSNAYGGVFNSTAGNRELDTLYADKGLLTKITYPTGGFDTLEYEPNSNYGTEAIYPPKEEYKDSLQNNEIFIQTEVDTFYIPIEQMVVFDCRMFVSDPDSLDKAFSDFKVYELSGEVELAGGSSYGELAIDSSYLQPGYYRVVHRAKLGTSVFSAYYYETGPEYVDKNIPTGGFRIKKVSTYENPGSLPQVKRYYYNHYSEKEQSYGLLNNKPYYLSTMQIKVCTSGGDLAGAYNIHTYAIMSSSSSVPLYSMGSGNIFYPNVTVSYGDNFENGGKEYTFRTNKDTPGAVIVGNGIIQAPKSNTGFDNGLLLKERIFKVGGDLVDVTLKEVENDYSYTGAPIEVRGLMVRKKYEDCGYYPVSPYYLCDGSTENDIIYSGSKTVSILGFKTEVSYDIYNAFSLYFTLKKAEKDIIGVTPCYDHEEGDTIYTFREMIENIEALEYKHISNWNILDSTKTTIYDENGQNPSVSTTYYDYDMLTQLPVKITTDLGNGEKIIKEMKYPHDLIFYRPEIPNDSICYLDYWESIEFSDSLFNTCNDSCQQNSPDHGSLVGCISECRLEKLERETLYENTLSNCFSPGDIHYDKFLYMLDKHLFNSLIEQSQCIIKPSGDTIYTNALLSFYEVSSSSTINKKSTHRLKSGATIANQYQPAYIDPFNNLVYSDDYEEVLSYDRYDAHGNLLQFTKVDGQTVSIVWGYNNVYPVAKVEGAGYSEIEAITSLNLSEINSGTFSELELQNSLKPIRDSLPNAFVTINTYKPLVGIKTMTDPNGKVTRYDYDDFGRLRFIKDHEEKIIKKIEYNYKN